jgi:Zn-dependent protease
MNALSRLFLAAFAFLKFGKVLISAGSMLIAVVAYAWVFGWRYAVGLVAMMFLHELGHMLAARRRGLDVGLPTFIPFFGAWVELKQRPHDAETSAFVALGGPLLGTISALVCYYLARNGDAPWLLAVAYSGFFINLLNLIPMPPFDGGQIMAVLSPRLWLLGVPILLALFWAHPNPVMLVMAILAVPYVFQALRRQPPSPEAQAYYAVSARTRWEYGMYYLVLILFLVVMLGEAHTALGSVERGGPASTSASDDV